MKTIAKALVLAVLCLALGLIGYLLFAQGGSAGLPFLPSAEAPQEDEPALPTAKVAQGTVEKRVTGPGEVKGAASEKLEMPEGRCLWNFDAPLNTRIPAGTPLVEFTWGDPLVAPYDLVVRSKNLPPDQWDELTDEHYVEVERVDKMHVVLDVPESDIASLAEGQNVEIKLNADEDRVLNGTVVGINQVGTYSATGSKYKVTIELENDGSMLIGMSANVSVVVAEAADVLTVPVSAIMGGSGSEHVQVQRPDGTLENVPVETGLSDGDVVEVRGDLAVGDAVVLNETPADAGNVRALGAGIILSTGE